MSMTKLLASILAALAVVHLNSSPVSAQPGEGSEVKKATDAFAGVPTESNPVALIGRAMERQAEGKPEMAETDYRKAWNAAWNWAFYDPTVTLPAPGGQGSVPSGSRRKAGIFWLKSIRSESPPGPFWEDEYKKLDAELEKNPEQLLSDSKKLSYWRNAANGTVHTLQQTGKQVDGTWVALFPGAAAAPGRPANPPIPVNVPITRLPFENGVLKLNLRTTHNGSVHQWVGDLTYVDDDAGNVVLTGKVKKYSNVRADSSNLDGEFTVTLTRIAKP